MSRKFSPVFSNIILSFLFFLWWNFYHLIFSFFILKFTNINKIFNILTLTCFSQAIWTVLSAIIIRYCDALLHANSGRYLNNYKKKINHRHNKGAYPPGEGALVFQAGYHPCKRTFKIHPKHIFFRYEDRP